MDDTRYVLCSVMEFEDGTMSVMELHRGCLEDCENLARLIPAICNSTGKRAVQSFLGMPTEHEFDAAMEGSS